MPDPIESDSDHDEGTYEHSLRTKAAERCSRKSRETSRHASWAAMMAARWPWIERSADFAIGRGIDDHFADDPPHAIDPHLASTVAVVGEP